MELLNHPHNMPKTIIGIMGPGEGAPEADCKNAYELGKLIAQQGWVLLTGGRNEGVMDAASKGAHEASGLVVGVLPDRDTGRMSEGVDIPIVTAMGGARNLMNVLSSQVVIACGIGLGTSSEIALALKAGKQVILLTDNQEAIAFFQKMAPEQLLIAKDVGEVIELTKRNK